MRTRGTVDDIRFKLVGWSIYAMSYEYNIMQLDYEGDVVRDSLRTVFVDTSKQLKSEINKYRESQYGT